MMNVLILTPDAVGSTLLQRLITIYMQFHQFDRPVINLHELTNGLHSFYSSDFNREIIGRSQKGYVQSLPDITNLLKQQDHYKVARLAQYHIRSRKDTLEQQIPFYRYLNDNFFVIATRRHNVFEHALSWGINKITKKLNVYTPNEKIDTFINLYKSSVLIDEQSLIDSLESYKKYLQWTDDHFSVGSYFYYDQHVQDIENYIFNLPIFAGQPKKISFNDVYGIEFSDWNRCHFFTSNIETLGLNNSSPQLQLTSNIESTDHLNFLGESFVKQLKQEYDNVCNDSWPTINSLEDFNNLPENIKQECQQMHNLTTYKKYVELKNTVACLPASQINFLEQHYKKYTAASESIEHMQQLGILPGGGHIPIKKQTLSAKKFMVKNFNQCVDTYNNWILHNPGIGQPFNDVQLLTQAEQENNIWRSDTDPRLLT